VRAHAVRASVLGRPKLMHVHFVQLQFSVVRIKNKSRHLSSFSGFTPVGSLACKAEIIITNGARHATGGVDGGA
jgi:hypothetical protein